MVESLRPKLSADRRMAAIARREGRRLGRFLQATQSRPLPLIIVDDN